MTVDKNGFRSEEAYVWNLDVGKTDTRSLQLLYMEAENVNFHRWNRIVEEELEKRRGPHWYSEARSVITPEPVLYEEVSA